LPEGKKRQCVSWKLNGTRGYWTSNGCAYTPRDTSSSICSCQHLSTFAILMSTQNDTGSYALKVVTYVGLSVSLVCLFLTIVTFLLCRSLWSVSISLHLQLSICLFF
ncbi:AGRE1 protein, partial [Chauna torquata]|nr:AGRE1 protein [Chauna torquata]